MTFHRRRFLGLAAVSAWPFDISAAHSPSSPLDDMAVLSGALTLHAGLYRYTSPRRLEQRLVALASEWFKTPTLEARYLALSRFLAKLQCGHSYCNFSNQSKAVADALFDRVSRLPFAFRWIDDAMVVTGDSGAITGLTRGTIVERLNGERPHDLLAALLPFARADGGNDAKRVALLEMRGTDRYESFDIFHGLLRGTPAGGTHKLQLRLPDGKRIARELPSISLAQRRIAMPPKVKDTAEWTWQMDSDAIATLTMPSWGLYNSKWDWQTWLDDRLSSLGNAKGLIVDIRANEGGLDCGNRILDRLTDRDLRFKGYDRCVRYRRTPAALDPYLDTWDDSFRVSEPEAVEVAGGYFRLPREAGVDVLTMRGQRVTAPVAILIGPTNSSATYQFAERCQQTGLARLFGRTTGGNRRGINGGRFFFVRLPQSGIEFDLPLIATLPTTPQPDAGITPDMAVRTTAADIANGRDPDMLAARNWLLRD